MSGKIELFFKFFLFTGLLFVFLSPDSAQAGGIAGELLDINGDQIHERIRVTAQLAEGGESRSTETDSGSYFIPNLREGDYWILTEGREEDTWFYRAYYPNAWSPGEGAETVFVPENETADLNVTLHSGGRFSGSVVPEEGGRFERYGIRIRYEIGQSWQSYNLEDPAVFESIALPAGEFRIKFEPTDEEDLHVPTYYGDTWSQNEADMVEVRPEAWTRNIDVSLPIGGGISGTVRGRVGRLQNARVEAKAIIEQNYMEHLRGEWTDQSGYYFIGGLPEIDCYVHFDPPDGSEYISEWYDDVYESSDATPIPIRAGEITRHIDAELELGATLFGNITAPDGSVPEPNSVYLDAVESFGDWHWLPIEIQRDGSWTSSRGLPPGIFTLEIRPQEPFWSEEYFGGSNLSWEATWIQWGIGERVGPLEIELNWGGILEGTVTDPDGEPVPDVELGLYLDTWQVHWEETGLNGHYRIQSVPPGNYRLEARLGWDVDVEIDRPWPAIYSGGAIQLSEAESFDIDARQTTDIDLQFIQGGILHATITKPGGGFYDVEEDKCTIVAIAVDDEGREMWNEPSSPGDPPFAGPDGIDIILPPGEYSLECFPVYHNADQIEDVPNVRRTFYGGSFSFEDAETFTITPGEITEIDMAMVETGHTIEGDVIAAEGDLPSVPFMATTDAEGRMLGIYFPFSEIRDNTFYINGIPDGEWYLFATSMGDESHLVSTWYPNIPDPGRGPMNMMGVPDGAQAIRIAGDDVTGVRVTMQRVPHVSVPEPDGSDPVITGYHLYGAYPNPFNDETRISFTLPVKSRVNLSLFNLLGRNVKEILNKNLSAGTHHIQLNGSSLSTGVYFIQMRSVDYEAITSVILMK